MKLSHVVTLLTSSSAFARADMDHDETSLLQTRATTMQAEESDDVQELYEVPAVDEVEGPEEFFVQKINHYTVNVHDDCVSLIQGKSATHDEENVLYTACAADNDGIEEETDDAGGPTSDSCGELDIFDAEGQYLGEVNACAPESVAEGECYDFMAPANYYGTISQSNGMINLPVQDSGDQEEVFLISIPAMEDSKLPSALSAIKKDVKDFSNRRVLFTGSGAMSMTKHAQRPVALRMFRLYRRVRMCERSVRAARRAARAQRAMANYHRRASARWAANFRRAAEAARRQMRERTTQAGAGVPEYQERTPAAST